MIAQLKTLRDKIRGSFHLKSDEASSNEFTRERDLRGIHSMSMIFIGASIFSFVAWLVFLGTIHQFDLSDSFQDGRQSTRLMMTLFAATFWFKVHTSPTAIQRNPRFWNLLGLALASVLMAIFGLSLAYAELASGLNTGTPPRLGTTVLIFTLAFYCVATQPKWLIGCGMLLAALPIIVFNARYSNAVAQGSFINFVFGVNLIGMIVYNALLRQDIALFKEQSRVKKLNLELDLAAQKAEEQSTAKTRLIAAISHDLRQPLNSLGLYNNLLKSRFGGEQNAALNSIAERVHECVSAMDGNLSRLQEIAQLQSGQVIAELTSVDLSKVLRMLESVFSPIAEVPGVQLRFSGKHSKKIFVESNPERLFEILSNLISNAIKFSSMATTRSPWVLVKVRSISFQGDFRQVRIDIRDNGIGIAAINQTRIFEEYVQLNNPERRGIKGYGLGLAVVRELCSSLKEHQVQVRSKLGAGARFTVWAPITHDQAPVKTAQLHENFSVSQAEMGDRLSLNLKLGHELSQTNVMLIEDDNSLRAALTAQLEELGATVRAYPSAKHALAATANDTESPTCIISDYWLPEPFDGLQCIDKLRAQFETPVPALLISAASDIDPKRLESLPNLEFALKPVSANTLLSYVLKHHRLK